MFKANRWICIVLTVAACGEDSSTPDTPSPGESFDSMEECQGHNVDISQMCADATPRYNVTVRDESGAPVKYARVFAIRSNLSTFVSEKGAPLTDGLNRLKTYFSCTNEEGEVTMCTTPDADPTKALREIFVYKQGYTHDTTGPLSKAEGTILDVDITLRPDADFTDEKVLVMTCEPENARAIRWLKREKVKYTLASFGKAIDALLPDPAEPLKDFDTFIIDMNCVSHESIGELLVPEKRARLHDWIRAGGLFWMFQQGYSGWSKSLDCAQAAQACPKDIYPAEYQFEYMKATSEGCSHYKSGRVVDAMHPLMQGLDFANWNFRTYQEEVGSGNPRAVVNWHGMDGATVNPSIWRVLATGPTQTEVEDEARSACPTAYNTVDNGIFAMEATLGSGKILHTNHSWYQASQGRYYEGVQYVEEAVKAADNALAYLKAHAK